MDEISGSLRLHLIIGSDYDFLCLVDPTVCMLETYCVLFWKRNQIDEPPFAPVRRTGKAVVIGRHKSGMEDQCGTVPQMLTGQLALSI